MNCKNCGGNTIVEVGCKCGDMFYTTIDEFDYDGYQNIPDVFGKDNDYINFSFCSNCGMIQSKFPVDVTQYVDEYDGENDND